MLIQIRAYISFTCQECKTCVKPVTLSYSLDNLILLWGRKNGETELEMKMRLNF